MTSPATIKTRLLIISDNHTRLPEPATNTKVAYREPLPSVDILLHCGDLTHQGALKEHERTFSLLKNADAELKLVIAGNHDLTLDGEYCDRMGLKKGDEGMKEVERIREMWMGPEARKYGIVYLEEELRTFTLKNGAQFTVSIDLGRLTLCSGGSYELS